MDRVSQSLPPGVLLEPNAERELRWRLGRGGKRQRERALSEALAQHGVVGQPAAATAELPGKFDSRLVYGLLLEWAWSAKDASAVKIQLRCHEAVKDQEELLESVGKSKDCASKSLRAFSMIGSSGRCPANCHRDLLLFLGTPNAVKSTDFLVPQKIAKPKAGAPAVQNIKMHFCLPHVQFAHLYQEHPQRFEEIYLGDKQPVEFWRGVTERRDPRLQYHPMCKRADFQERAIPYMLHADAVPVVKVGKAGTQSLDVYSYQSVLSKGSTLRIKMLIWSTFEARL